IQDLIKIWATKLSSCQNFYQNYSADVNNWDKVLTENSKKLSELFADIVEAEQSQNKINSNLMYLEKQQDDIEKFLDYYEDKINSIYSNSEENILILNNGNKGNNNNNSNVNLSNDRKREESYNNAILIDEHLDELSNDLTVLINDINDISDVFNKSIYKDEQKPGNDKSDLLQVHKSQTNERDNGSDNGYKLSSIIKLLNNHLNSLRWLENNSELLRDKI
ncbi:uncharacterized protein ASCRUDRAFT_21115, partial [Ascoidea rubescens DSM 1968]